MTQKERLDQAVANINPLLVQLLPHVQELGDVVGESQNQESSDGTIYEPVWYHARDLKDALFTALRLRRVL